VIDVGLPFALQAMNDHLLAPYKVATWDSIPAAAKDAEGYWVGDYYGLIVFEVNSRFVSEAPADWPDLLNADYSLALGGYPAHSYMGMVTVYSASLANGGSLDDTIPGLRYFQQINRDGHLSANFNADRASVTSGETPLLLTWDYLALADKRSNSDIEVVVPKSGLIAGLYAQGISAYAPHPNAARLWMEFLYSDEGQLLFLEGLGHPVRFADLHERGIIPDSVLLDLLPAEPYLQALFPTAEQMSAADKSILGSWRSYVR
jgi:putative spermidine/putrescine transport system substrate-binding protein